MGLERSWGGGQLKLDFTVPSILIGLSNVRIWGEEEERRKSKLIHRVSLVGFVTLHYRNACSLLCLCLGCQLPEDGPL